MQSFVEEMNPTPVWSDPAMRELNRLLARVAPTPATVFIEGESGTGKEHVARRIHDFSTRSAGPFVKINCAALPDPLLESELFGHAAGAFTGADSAKRGRFELADGGTLFLDEVAELSLALQAKLLHVLEDLRFVPLGSNTEREVDVRVVCATHADLRDRVRRGLFRKDLFYRLDVVGIRVPPLRERPEALDALVESFRVHYAARYGRPAPQMTRSLVDELRGYAFPGNVRELENWVKRWVVLGRDSALLSELRRDASDELGEPTDPDTAAARHTPELPLREVARRAAQSAERQVIARALSLTGGDLKRAARMLGVSYKTLLGKTDQRVRSVRP